MPASHRGGGNDAESLYMGLSQVWQGLSALFKGRHEDRTGWSESGIAITDGGHPTLL